MESTSVGSDSTAVMRMREVCGRRRLLSIRKSRPIISGMRWSEMMTANSRSATIAKALSGLETATT